MVEELQVLVVECNLIDKKARKSAVIVIETEFVRNEDFNREFILLARKKKCR